MPHPTLSPSRRARDHALSILCTAVAATVFAASPAGAQVQSKDQQKCINDVLKRGAGVAKAQGKADDACLKNAIAGKTSKLGDDGDTLTAQACLTNDVGGKVAKADAKLADTDTQRCLTEPQQLPAYAYTGAAVVGGAQRDQATTLAGDLFGGDLDAVTLSFAYPDDDAKKCQRAALSNAHKFSDALAKTAAKEVKGALKGGKNDPAESAAELQVAALGAIVTDPKGKVDKATTKLSDKIVDACTPTSAALIDLFPGACSAVANPTELGACVDTLVRCRFCEALSASAAMAEGCDQFDDTTVNGSCSGGAAVARAITDPADLIDGPLAHGKLGDYLLANDVARFIVQDVGQRDMYSVGAFGGNLIDAELLANPGLDNFLEIQPGINAETVINAQTVEIVNDGSNGAPAIVRTCGPDDVLDFVNPSTVVSGAGFPFPVEANDRDSAVVGCTSYILEPGSTAVQMVTTVFNIGNGTEQLLAGDFINAAGEVELWGSGNAGIGEQLVASLDVLSYIGFGQALGVDYSHVTVPLTGIADSSSFFSTSGVAVVLHSQSLIDALLGNPPNFVVPEGGSNSFVRYFGVGDGSGANAIDLLNRVRSIANGEVSGCVTVGGAAAPGARVTAGPISGGEFTNVSSNWTTDASGCYSGTLAEGSYGMAAWREGTPFEGGGSSPQISMVTIADGAPVVQDFALPATGTLDVSVTDENGSAVPARVSVIGFDPSPEFVFIGGLLSPEATGLFRDQNDTVPFGFVGMAYTDAAGMASIDVEPGDYHVFVSRGTEYSLFDLAVTIGAGATTNVAAQIGRVLDTPGFVSSDFHVHGINSADSRVSHRDRIQQFAGEGVDNIVMTDHHAHTDLGPTIAALGFTPFVHSTVGEEVTTWDTGHYNAYPFTVDPMLASGGSSDWGRAAPPGEDFPSLGAYIATPSEVEQIIENNPTALPETVVQINHINSHFVPMEIDTSIVPPVSGLTPQEMGQFRLDPGSGNLFHHFPALEVWNGDSRGAQSNFINERMGIWFNLMNQGLPSTAIADTDTHRLNNLGGAGARSWTSSTSDDPASVSPAEVAVAVREGRVVGGQGVYVQTRLVANENPSLVADLTLGGTTEITIGDAAQGVTLEIDVQAPIWAEFDTIEIYANPATIPSPTSSADELFGATPTLVLTEGTDFSVTQTVVHAGVTGADRLEASVSESFTNLTEDTWFVVVVRGSDGVSQPMFPVYPSSLDSGSNTTVADLIDGNLGEGGVLALGYTNALFVDADGVPGFQAPLAP